jgi:hypothetical protein
MRSESNTNPDWYQQLSKLQFTWAKFNFHLLALEDLILPPYKGSALRGGFGYSFRKVCCVMQPGDKCTACTLNKVCAYAYIFETPQTAHENIQHQAENFPHPFVIEPPATRQNLFKRGAELTFSLVLIGKSLDYLPYFVFAFHQLGEMGLGKGRGKFRLQFVTLNSESSKAEQTVIYDHESQTLNSNFQSHGFKELLQQTQTDSEDKIKLYFLTPTRLSSQNKLAQNLPFDLVIRSLLRRQSLLAGIHCDNTWNLPYPQIIESARENVRIEENQLDWADWERYSTRQDRRMQLGGIVGMISYTGSLKAYLPWLRLGEITHIGKNTAFGLGRYVIQ